MLLRFSFTIKRSQSNCGKNLFVCFYTTLFYAVCFEVDINYNKYFIFSSGVNNFIDQIIFLFVALCESIMIKA